MARFPSGFKRSILRRIKSSIAASGLTLREALEAVSIEISAHAEGGYLVQSTSGAGHSNSFFVPMGMGAGLTPVTLAELYEELLDIYDAAAYALDSEDQDAIFSEMLDRLRGVRRVRVNFVNSGV